MNRRRFVGVLGAGSLSAAVGVRAKAWLGIPAPRAVQTRARVTVVVDETLGKLSPNILGHFTEHLGGCVYGGMWVGPDSSIPNENGLRKDTLAALRRIHAPIIRWPGGCFADTYHWRDGIGPRERRPKTWNLWWGREESNAFGTDEFLAYCRLAGSSPYFCVNVGSGTVEEAVAWMDYVNGDHATSLAQLRGTNGHPEAYGVKYWSIGNENWGCGGNFDAEDYARQYARFSTYLEKAAGSAKVEFVACGDTRGDWNQKFFETLLGRPEAYGHVRRVHHLSIHHYFSGGPAIKFTDDDYYRLLASVGRLEGLIRKTLGTIDTYTQPQGPSIGIALDEWGVWHPSEGTGDSALLQPNTLRDALLAASALNMLNSFGSRISMGCIAQTFNVLQSMANTRGNQMVLTPTYYTFDLFQPHMSQTGVRVAVESPTFEATFDKDKVARDVLSASASLDSDKKQICLTVSNQHLTEPLEVEIEIAGVNARIAGGTYRELTSADVRDENSFERPNVIAASNEKPLSASANPFTWTIPPHTVQALVVRLA